MLSCQVKLKIFTHDNLVKKVELTCLAQKQSNLDLSGSVTCFIWEKEDLSAYKETRNCDVMIPLHRRISLLRLEAVKR